MRQNDERPVPEVERIRNQPDKDGNSRTEQSSGKRDASVSGIDKESSAERWWKRRKIINVSSNPGARQ
jgi:hypothetical protein